MNNRIIFWALTCFLVTLFCGLVYATTLSSIRQAGNDPQIQITQDILSSLKAGADPSQLSANRVDLKTAQSAFVVIYDKNKKAVASTGELDKKIPVPPDAAFDGAKKFGENRFSWEPTKDLRFAAVLVSYDKGFVLAARSLKETQNRISRIVRLVGIAWVLGIGATSLAFFLTRPRTNVIVTTEKPAPVRKSRTRSKK